MKLVRRYPEEADPLLRVFAEDAIPDSVWSWPPQERAQRLRYALISLCAGLHPVIVWPLAFHTDPSIEADIERTLAVVSDADILQMLRSADRADWMKPVGHITG